MAHPNFSILLSDFVYGVPTSSETVSISNVEKPKCYKFLDSASHPSKKGIYVIFSPKVTNFNTKGEGCIYVGEGNIKDRLYSHKRNERFGSKENEFIVIFYEIENQVDRRAVERILIKYYKPAYNKEGVTTLDQVRKESNFSKSLRKTIKELSEIFKGLNYSDGKSYEDEFDFTAVVVNHLQSGYSLEEIETEVTKYHMEEINLDGLAEFLDLEK